MLKRSLFSGESLRGILLYIFAIASSILFIAIGNRVATKSSVVFSDSSHRVVAVAKVTDVISRSASTMEWGDTQYESVVIIFRASVTSGRYEGSSVSAVQINEPTYPVKLRDVKPGDSVLLTFVEQSESGPYWMLQEYNRVGPLIWLGVVFMVFSVLFGQTKGLNTILSLSFTCLAIFLVFIPSILSGHNIYAVTYIICAFVVVTTLVLVNGVNQKSLAAGIGCLGGLVGTGLIFALMDKFLMLSGYVNEESVFLMGLDTASPIDLKAIIFAAIIIGALGATMDVAVSIASSLSEIDIISGGASPVDIVKSGIAIGRDIMGTMANTLILAYVGSSLSLVLLLVAYANSLIELLNRELIIVEILQALAGSLGLLITIPLTSLVFARLVHIRGNEKNSPEPEKAQNDGLQS